jgi:hypothetical protein
VIFLQIHQHVIKYHDFSENLGKNARKKPDKPDKK